jgi:hypothetical protein
VLTFFIGMAATPLTIQPAVADSRYPLFWQSKAI